MRPRIGQLIPWAIALGVLLDASTRLVPLDLFAFRAWEVLVVGRGPTGPFEPDRIYANPLSYGDLSRPHRYAALRQHHFEYFSTDRWGFRNTVPPAEPPVDWLLVGDSFGVSSGVRDSGTLASQLSRLSGARVYNASSFGPLPIGDIRFTASRLGMAGGLVVFEFMERQDLPAGTSFAGDARIYSDGPPAPARGAGERYRVWRKDAAVSRLGILAGWGWDALTTKTGIEQTAVAVRERAAGERSAAQPTDLATGVGTLADGSRMLFFLGDVEATRKADRRIPADYLVWLRGELAKSNLRLAVLIAPTKYQVYGPLVREPADAPPPQTQPLDRLAAELTANGILAVNTTAALRQAAADGLAHREHLYFVDDTHWNERGIEVAARAFVDAWRVRSR